MYRPEYPATSNLAEPHLYGINLDDYLGAPNSSQSWSSEDFELDVVRIPEGHAGDTIVRHLDPGLFNAEAPEAHHQHFDIRDIPDEKGHVVHPCVSFVEANVRPFIVDRQREPEPTTGRAQPDPAKTLPHNLCVEIETESLLIPLGALVEVRHAEAQVEISENFGQVVTPAEALLVWPVPSGVGLQCSHECVDHQADHPGDQDQSVHLSGAECPL